METTHRIIAGTATNLKALATDTIDLIVTSPPYPMVEMWDTSFSSQDGEVKQALARHDPGAAFEKMHRLLDAAWEEAYRLLKPGGFACINIGDATRTVNGCFMLYPNHARILSHMTRIGFTTLPLILWRKQTNAPNKFMGSGMLPAGAYVTLEHEYVLIARKGGKRSFTAAEEKRNRHASALFWEERNQWFSDVWMDLKGARQDLDGPKMRKRSGAFPFELPYRLICMYSVKGDTVLDPFAGMGTTALAAATAARNSISCELETDFCDTIRTRLADVLKTGNHRLEKRIGQHLCFVEDRLASGAEIRHRNRPYGFPVITAQEKELVLNRIIAVNETTPNQFDVGYDDAPQIEDCAAQYQWPADQGKTTAGRKAPAHRGSNPCYKKPSSGPPGIRSNKEAAVTRAAVSGARRTN